MPMPCIMYQSSACVLVKHVKAGSLALLLAIISSVSSEIAHAKALQPQPSSRRLLSPFRLLSLPYSPCSFRSDTDARPVVWLDVFRRDTASFERRAADIDPERARRFAGAFESILLELEQQG